MKCRKVDKGGGVVVATEEGRMEGRYIVIKGEEKIFGYTWGITLKLTLKRVIKMHLQV